MTTSPPSGAEISTADTLTALLPSWRRSLAARRISPRTIATYTISVEQLADYLAAHGMPTAAAGIRREHIEAFLEDLLTRKAPATAHNRFRGSQAFFRWCLEEGEVRESPMARMKPPRLPEAPAPVLLEAQLRKLVETTERDRSFAGLRDAAIIRLLLTPAFVGASSSACLSATWTSTPGS